MVNKSVSFTIRKKQIFLLFGLRMWVWDAECMNPLSLLSFRAAATKKIPCLLLLCIFVLFTPKRIWNRTESCVKSQELWTFKLSGNCMWLYLDSFEIEHLSLHFGVSLGWKQKENFVYCFWTSFYELLALLFSIYINYDIWNNVWAAQSLKSNTVIVKFRRSA